MGEILAGLPERLGHDQHLLQIPELEGADRGHPPPDQHQLLLVHVGPEGIELERHLGERVFRLLRLEIEAPVGDLRQETAGPQSREPAPVAGHRRVHVLEAQLLIASQVTLHPLTRMGGIEMAVIEVVRKPGPALLQPLLVIGAKLGPAQGSIGWHRGEDRGRDHGIPISYAGIREFERMCLFPLAAATKGIEWIIGATPGIGIGDRNRSERSRGAGLLAQPHLHPLPLPGAEDLQLTHPVTDTHPDREGFCSFLWRMGGTDCGEFPLRLIGDKVRGIAEALRGIPMDGSIARGWLTLLLHRFGRFTRNKSERGLEEKGGAKPSPERRDPLGKIRHDPTKGEKLPVRIGNLHRINLLVFYIRHAALCSLESKTQRFDLSSHKCFITKILQ